MAPAFEAAARALEDEPDVRFLKVNTEELPEVAAAFGIRSIPTVVVLLGEEVVDSAVGVVPEQILEKMARRALDRSRGITLGTRIKRLFSPREQAAGAAS
jgi:thioredoxin-like negative regulator of GroEL